MSNAKQTLIANSDSPAVLHHLDYHLSAPASGWCYGFCLLRQGKKAS